MPDISIILSEMFRVSPVGYGIVLTLTAMTAVMIKSMTDATGLTALFSAVNAFGAFVGMYVWRFVGISVVFDREANQVIGACIGMIIAFVIMMGLTRATYALRDNKKALERADLTRR